jgi:succinate dehydrogenase / fumarate reductase cytochrome b subunit
MSSTAPSKRARPTNSLPSGNGLLQWLKPILASSVGSKFLVAITGLALSGFVVVHMLGNLQIFLGPDEINEYAKKLKEGVGLLWTLRIGLLTVFVIHIVLAIRLNIRAREARPIPYAHEETVQASYASRTMIYSGLVILAFAAFHIAHYTLGVVQPAPQPAPTEEAKKKDDKNDETKKKDDKPATPIEISLLELRDDKGRHDVYRMMIIGFSHPLVASLYLIAQIVLMMHLSHGIASTFQSLGLNTPRLQTLWFCLSWAITLIVGGGNIAIVIAVWAGWIT